VNVLGDGELPGDALRCARDDLQRGGLAVAERAQEMAEGAVLRRRIGGGREALVVIGVMVNGRDRVVVSIVGRMPPAHGAGQGEQDR